VPNIYAAVTAAKKLAVLRRFLRFLIFNYMAEATAVNTEAPRFFVKSPPMRSPPWFYAGELADARSHGSAKLRTTW
jgi:hypothetical protein